MAIALALPVPECSEVEVLGRSEEEVDRLAEEPGGPNVADERAIEGVELGTGERLPAFATAIVVGLFSSRKMDYGVTTLRSVATRSGKARRRLVEDGVKD
jgi:hypothetical protein